MPTIATTTLPAHDDLLARLNTVDASPHTVNKFFPIVLRASGRELTGMGVVLMLILAISDYTVGLPPLAVHAMQLRLEEYVRALVDDQAVQGDALEALDKMGLRLRNTGA